MYTCDCQMLLFKMVYNFLSLSFHQQNEREFFLLRFDLTVLNESSGERIKYKSQTNGYSG